MLLIRYKKRSDVTLVLGISTTCSSAGSGRTEARNRHKILLAATVAAEPSPMLKYLKEAFWAGPQVPGLGRLPANALATLGCTHFGDLETAVASVDQAYAAPPRERER